MDEKETTEVNNSDLDNVKMQPYKSTFMTILIDLISAPCSLLCCCGGCYVVNEREESIIFRYGKYVTTQKNPGMHWSYPTMREIKNYSTKISTVDLPNTKITDCNGNPLMVSAILNYRVVDTMKACLNVNDYKSYVSNQAQTIMKRIISKYPYESANEKDICLKNGNKKIQDDMATELEKIVKIAGIKIDSFLLNELSYSVEVASIMLKKQQAKALVEAKQIIMDGSVGLAIDTVNEIEKRGITMSDSEKSRLVTNLLTISVGNNDPQPTLQIS